MVIESWSDFYPEVNKLKSGESYDKGVLAVGVIADPKEGDPLQLWEDNTSDKATVELRVGGLEGNYSSIKQTVDSIKSEVFDANNNSRIEQLSDSISNCVADTHDGTSFSWKMLASGMKWWNNKTSEADPLMSIGGGGLRIKGHIEAESGKIGGMTIQSVNETLGQYQNLLLDSAYYQYIRTNADKDYSHFNPNFKNSSYGTSLIAKEKEFTLSFDYYITNVTSDMNLAFGLNYSDSAYTELSKKISLRAGKLNEGHYSCTFTPTDNQRKFGSKWLMFGFGEKLNKDINI
jgi:hypothetical protein